MGWVVPFWSPEGEGQKLISGQRDRLSILKFPTPGSATTPRLSLKSIPSPRLDIVPDFPSLIRPFLGVKTLPIKAVANMDMNSKMTVTATLCHYLLNNYPLLFHIEKQFQRETKYQ